VAPAIAAGAHPKAIQSMMGHSSINVTLDRYGHLFPELDEAIAAAFDAQLSAADGDKRPTVVRAGTEQCSSGTGTLATQLTSARPERSWRRAGGWGC
jgi:hypothetical protein